MEQGRENNERQQRRFRKATDGPVIRRLYAMMRTADLAHEMGLTVKQITNYVYRHSDERWARKNPSVRSQINRENAKKRWERGKNTRLKCKYFLSTENFPEICRQNIPQRPSKGLDNPKGPPDSRKMVLPHTAEPLDFEKTVLPHTAEPLDCEKTVLPHTAEPLDCEK